MPATDADTSTDADAAPGIDVTAVPAEQAQVGRTSSPDRGRTFD